MAKRRGTKQNKRKTKQNKKISNIICLAFLLLIVPRNDQLAAGSSILCYLFLYFIFLVIPQSFTGLFIVVVLLSSLKEIMS